MPRGLPSNVKKSLEKSIDSALLAVEIYNKPAVKFKSGGYVVLMVISWTALFHAIFFKNKKRPFYKKNNRFEKKDNDYCYWELSTCINEYFGEETNHPIRKNLEFFIPLRNMIEHKSIPEIDSDIFAECQSLLLNYDKMVFIEFGEKYCIKECLSFALQLYPSSKNLINAVIENPVAKPIVDFIKAYRSSLTTETINSGEYSFKAFLIQVANHQSKNTLPIQFVAYDKLDENQKANVNRVAALVKQKFVTVNVSNKDLLKPSTVVKKVQIGIGNPRINKGKTMKNKFNMDTHTRCWRKYAVRPENNASAPEHTSQEYCVYDLPNANYLYTVSWVEFLIEKMSDEEEFNSLYIN